MAWNPLGWEGVWHSEIERFPAEVFAAHHGGPNLGDMTKIKGGEVEPIELLVGGTPCQSFSVAGLRKGLADPRGNLALVFLKLIDEARPRWVVWENVPGVLSSNKGRDFGAFVGGLGQLGYGWAYRVLDAQFAGVPQRRRRVFVVGYSGDWRPATAVLFERHSLQGHPAPSRQEGERVAGTIKGGSGNRGYPDPSDGNGGMLIETQYGAVAGSLTARHDSSPCADRGQNIVAFPANLSGTQCASTENLAPTLGAKNPTAVAFAENSRNELRLEGGDGQRCGALSTGGGKPGQGTPMIAQAVNIRGRDGGATAELSGETATAIRASQGGGDKLHCLTDMAVRRLTPVECERLQGFGDNYTRIPWRGKTAEDCPDGPRYKALGNSMAVPVMRWIGERINLVETLKYT